jgi:cell surface protein SprA
MSFFSTNTLKTAFFTLCAWACLSVAYAQKDSTQTTLDSNVVIPRSGREPAYRWKDHYLNRFSDKLLQSPLILADPKNVKTDFSLNPANKNVSVTERIGQGIDYKLPQSMTFNQYSSIQNRIVKQNLLREYEQSQDGNGATRGKGLRPLLEKNPVVDRIFGGNIQDIKPTGSVTVILEGRRQIIDNPLLPLISRNQGIQPYFDLIPNINFNGKIGEKMGLMGNFDAKAAFNFENQMRLNFKNQPEDILQKVEAGNVSMPINSQLIPGVQNLMGFKAGLKLGKLDITAVVAQQRSRTQSIVLNGGGQNKPYEIRCDNYEENRHFFLSHFFRENYERSLSQLPVITSNVRITRMEVYITNRTNNVETMRNVVALRDLGEADKEYKNIELIKKTPTDNKGKSTTPVNPIYNNLIRNNNSFRNDAAANNYLANTEKLVKGTEYEFLRGARRLAEREYRFQPELGYISLVTPLRNDEVLAVAYEYIYKGQTYKVGELTEDYGAYAENDVIVMKLLKSATVRNRTQTDPLWKLMMKNVYSLGASQLSKDGFSLRIIYKDDKTGVDNPFLQDGVNIPDFEKKAGGTRILKDIPLLNLFGLDKLNPNNDPVKGGDGNFDFVEDVTVDAKLGRVIIPRLEPFGSNLKNVLSLESTQIQDKYFFEELYTKTLADAQQVTTKNKFFIRGSSMGGGNAEVQLPLGAGQSGVRVYAGGQTLQEGTDYMLDPQSGRLRITNQSVLNSSRQIRVEYELPDLFQTQNRGLFGLRLDYNVSPSLHLGFTGMKMRESPAGFLTRTAIGNEPVNNNIIGTDINFKKESRFLTRVLDRLPLIQTKEISAVQFSAEYAKLFPSINTKRISNNSAMIDDFEAARNINDLTRGANRWRLGSTPQFDYTTGSSNSNGRATDYKYHFNRAKISVYTPDPSLYLDGSGFGNVNIPDDLLSDINNNIYEKPFVIQDIFAGRSQPVAGTQLPIASLDIAYFPEERGMYNYSTDVNPDGSGRLNNPTKNFGSIMRGITADNDFENANTEYLTFWMLNPFKAVVRDGKDASKHKINTGGRFFIHLGDISEDVIPDTYHNFENGILPPSYKNSVPYPTEWGRAPRVQYMIDAFDNDPDARAIQDIGLDGLDDKGEVDFKNIKDYLNEIRPKVSPDVYSQILKDPSSDNFKFFLDEEFNSNSDKFITRFKNYLGMERNSPVINNSQELTPSTSILPDKEDINADNTINDTEGYHEYEIDMRTGLNSLAVGKNNIIDKVVSGDGNSEWLLFRIPVRKPNKSHNINSFKSIRFMRLVMTDFKEPVVMRFAAMQFESNSYRLYDKDLNNPLVLVDTLQANKDTKIKIGVVNVEENGCDLQSGNCNIKDGNIPYLVPPDFQRDRDVTQQNFFQFNEQSLSMNIEKLRAGDGRAVFKNTRLDLLFYKNLRMFIHAHHNNPAITRDSTAGAFIRIGTDLTENFYEIELPKLAVTPFTGSSSSYTEKDVWRNVIDFPLDILRKLKSRRNASGKADSTLFVPDYGVGGDAPRLRKYRIRVIGNPDLSTIMTVMLGVKNPVGGEVEDLTVWMNELRASDFDQTAGDAAIMSADIKLADLATISLTGNFKNYGFGGVQDRISERARDNAIGFGVAANIKVDKLFPESWGLQIPLFVNYDNQTVKPYFNPLDPDMPLFDELNSLNFISDSEKRNFRKLANDVSERRGFNFSNVRKTKTGQGKSHFYDIENFSFTYAKNLITRTNILTKQYEQRQIRGGINYQFQTQNTKSWEPFKKIKSLDKPMFFWLKDFNLNPIPSVISFRTDFDRNYMKTHLRSTDDQTGKIKLDETGGIQNRFFERYFWFNRGADLQWNLSKSLLVNYSSDNHAIIDEENDEYEKGSLISKMTQFGKHRVKNFDQRLTTTYRLPLDKLFLLDWMQADAKYNTNFSFQASAFDISTNLPFRDENEAFFGNLAKNGREYGLQGRVDLVKLYNKFKFLRAANAPKVPKKRFTRNPADDEEIEIPKSDVTKTFTRLLMAVRGINVDYTMIETTILPGYLATPTFMGSNGKNPGYGFSVFGRQFVKNPYGFLENLNKRASVLNENSSLSNSLFLNDPFTQTRQKRFSYSTNIEPFKDFRVQIRGQLTRGDAYSYFYRDAEGKNLGKYSAVQTGNFSMSFWGINWRNIKAITRGVRTDSASNYSYELYDRLLDNRKTVRDYLNGVRTEKSFSYDSSSQDVLIPAFFAAYAGKDAKSIVETLWKLQNGGKNGNSKSPFFLPLPNWRIDFGGLANLKPFNKWFSSMTINHSYTSTFNVGNYTSSLLYGNDFGDQYLGLAMKGYKFGNKFEQDDPNKLFAPVFVMSTITLEQKFQPLIGINFVTKSKITGRLEYNMERRAGLNLANSQVAEYNSDDFVFGFGFKKNNVKLPIKGRDGKNIILKNDVNFRLDWTIQNIKGLQRRIDGDPQPTMGGRNVQLRPNIQYQVNKRIMMNLYFTRTINDPFTSIGFYQLNSTGGVNLRFSLSE